MCTAGIVAYHSSNRAAIVSRRVRAKSQLMNLCCISKSVQHDAGLNARIHLVGVQFENLVHVLGEIQYDGDVATLSCQASARAASQNWGAEFSTHGNGGNYILIVAGDYKANRDMAVVGGVRCVERPSSGIK